ncbi:glycosyltransferase [Ramlibacter sp.]|uniref:glycosyltransferase n=1 Tax=Ramlibacter sp. TaxID=1917967 RepID=UPI003D12C317
MRILLVSHTSHLGGAEQALLNLLDDLIALGHEPTVMLPENAGVLFQRVLGMKKAGCVVFPMPWSVPTPSRLFAEIGTSTTDEVEAHLRQRGCDLVISNTLVILHGAVLAGCLGVPHIAWSHELVVNRSILATAGLPSTAYIRQLHAVCDHMLCCSGAVRAEIVAAAPEARTTVLLPFRERGNPAPSAEREGTLRLVFVGGILPRKNLAFAIVAVKALRMRGVEIGLDVFGGGGPDEQRVREQIARLGLAPHVVLHGFVTDWIGRVRGRPIHLIAATHEPFGLTVPESLREGIPVVASMSGGPQEMLGEAYLYAHGDLDRAVRIVESIAADYRTHARAARERYRVLAPAFGAAHQRQVVQQVLAAAARDYRAKQLDPYLGTMFSDALRLKRLPRSALVANIAAVIGDDSASVEARIALESRQPGAAVQADCRTYDVVPFAMSAQMKSLYAGGSGFVLELAATYDSPPRMLMAAFIMTRLLNLQSVRDDVRLRVLAVGDGLGFDAMRIAGCGFDVDCMDYDDSVTARVARANIASFIAAAQPLPGAVRMIAEAQARSDYNAVICLEVLEHVSRPGEMLAGLAARLVPGGLAFISECFDGVREFWPTHLHENEALAGTLPRMGEAVGLDYEGMPLEHPGKPHVFVKRSADTSA